MPSFKPLESCTVIIGSTRPAGKTRKPLTLPSGRGTDFPYQRSARQPGALPRGYSISDLTVIRLNDEAVEGQEELAPWPPPEGLAPEEDPFSTVALAETPEFMPGARAQSTARDWRLNTERAFALSVILHLLLVIALLTIKLPERRAENKSDPLGLMSLMQGTPPDPSIPVQFFPAPGPKAQQPGPRPLPSDMNRQAHGGDPQLPVLPVPKAYPQAGIRDLDAGRPGAPSVARPARGDEAGDRGRKLTDLGQSVPMSDPPTPEERAAMGRLRGLPSLDLGSISAQDAKRAAQADGGQGGENGGGFDRDGGFVDSGPLSFDTVGYDWGAYAAEMIRKIKRNWDVPALARYGVKGRLTIRFYILKDGRVEAERILSNSGVPPFDNAAFLAISHASPFRPLPSDLGHDREGVTVTFFYNIRPEDTEPAGRR
jgi:TonB family protein